MPVFSPESLANWTRGRWTGSPERPLTGFGIDSRTIRAGDVFVALKTPQRDGHAFLGAARAAGAAAALVAQADASVPLAQLVVPDPLAALQAIAHAWRRLFPGPVAAISGSAGKTSTKNLLALLLGPQALATEGNLNNHLGVPLTLTRLDPAVHRFAVIEAGIGSPGEMATLAAMIEPDVAIITLIAAAHLEAFGSLESVAREKALLPAAVRPGGIAFLPESCLAYDAFRRLRVPTTVIGRTVAITQTSDRTQIVLEFDGKPFVLPRVSDGMARNAALAISAALWLRVPAEDVRSRLDGWRPPALRGEVRRIDGRLVYVDCYNANPAAMADALAAFRAVAPAGEPRLFVLGGMEELGPGAARFHRELGRSLRLGPADRVIALGPHAGEVGAGAIETGARPDQVETAESAAAAAGKVAGFAGAVFVKGSRKYSLEKVLELPVQC